MNVLKNCLSLVNNVIEYSQPIRLDESYRNYAESFLTGRYGYFDRFEYDHSQYLNYELSTDLSPRFYCIQWFSSIIGVLEVNGMHLDEIEKRYYEYLENPSCNQLTIFDVA